MGACNVLVWILFLFYVRGKNGIFSASITVTIVLSIAYH
jgi:hypothetical protein